jgi:catechol 2,3-dioxygenase-like lactoylglutathione lyase family enzyme
MIKKATPVLIVDRIEPLLPLWDALSFSRAAEVPHGDELGFVILTRDGVEVMYQTFDSVRSDEAKVLEGPRAIGAAAVFIEVDDIEALEGLLPDGTAVVVTRRTTFYGSTEIVIRDAAGNVITFAQFAPA